MQKLNTEGNPQTIFAIKSKEIKPKPKSNIRLQTELGGNLNTEKTKNSNSITGKFALNNGSSVEDASYAKPSFIE